MSDLSPVQMFEAADVLEKVSKHYGYPNPQYAPWNAEELRREADQLLQEVL